MSQVGITDFAPTFKHLPKLTRVFLDENPIGDEGLIVFVSFLKYLPKLEYLYLKSTGISDKGVQFLAQNL